MTVKFCLQLAKYSLIFAVVCGTLKALLLALAAAGVPTP